MKEKKTQAKSVRMTPTVYSIVDQCEGRGFNDKFERFVLQTKKDQECLKREISDWHEIRVGYQKEADRINEIRSLLKASEERIEYIDAYLGILCNWILSLGSDDGEQADNQSLHSRE